MNDVIKLPQSVLDIIGRLRKSGHEAYAVGGCVRNCLMGLEPKDYDVTTSASPEEIKSVFSGAENCHTVDTGIRYGTVTVITGRLPVEVTTYRVDGEYHDNRRPESVEFTDKLSEDLKRRDFTVNAFAYSEESGIIDIFDGRKDLENRLLRAIGDPTERFNEDGLRILRALRFASCYGMSIEDKTAAAVHENKLLLQNIAVERITAEFDKILCGDCEGVLREYHDVISVFLPELSRCVGFLQHSKYHDRDVFEHIIATVSAVPKKRHLRLAMLLHDIGKPDYFTVGADGAGHFKGHAVGSTEIAERFLKRMKYDRATADKVLSLVRYHDIVIENREPLIKRYLNKFGEELFFDLIDVHIADDMGKAEECRKRIAVYKAAADTAREIIEKKECFGLKDLAVNGNDIKALGFVGQEIGEELSALLLLVIDGKCENSRDALLKTAASDKKRSDGLSFGIL